MPNAAARVFAILPVIGHVAVSKGLAKSKLSRHSPIPCCDHEVNKSRMIQNTSYDKMPKTTVAEMTPKVARMSRGAVLSPSRAIKQEMP